MLQSNCCLSCRLSFFLAKKWDYDIRNVFWHSELLKQQHIFSNKCRLMDIRSKRWGKNLSNIIFLVVKNYIVIFYCFFYTHYIFNTSLFLLRFVVSSRCYLLRTNHHTHNGRPRAHTHNSGSRANEFPPNFMMESAKLFKGCPLFDSASAFNSFFTHSS